MLGEATMQLLRRLDARELRRNINFVHRLIRSGANVKYRIIFSGLLRRLVRGDHIAGLVGEDFHLHDHICQSLWNSGKYTAMSLAFTGCEQLLETYPW
jgi:hypothetical protein